MKDEFTFLDPGQLIDNDLELILINKIPADDAKGYVPAYKFAMKNRETGETMGQIDLRIGNNKNIQYGGHLGYGVDEQYRGKHYAARSVKLLLHLAKKHGINRVLITCNPENIASRKTCELAGGNLVDIVDLPEDNEQYQQGDRKKCIYEFNL